MTTINTKTNLLDLNRKELREFLQQLGEKPFRADQLMKWIYHFGEDNFDNMSNINKVLREKLKTVAEIKAPEVAEEQRSADGTIKEIGYNQLDGNYVVNGDEPATSMGALRQFYDTMVAEPDTMTEGLVVNTVSGRDDKWSASQALNRPAVRAK